ncbi:c-type cytochrome [Eudoraea chungangensis]|uniref:c-type cytochrome n=1 Tax=Eudoraea chungangensis TaxID=1481905 RepID=UPI0023EC837B|nr:cytochrome c [Eudoraea chungangensis]
MKINKSIYSILFAVLLLGCGGKEEKKEGFSVDRAKEVDKTFETPVVDEVPASQRVTLDEKGVGPIKDITLDPEIDPEMAAAGEALFKTNCTACHKLDKRFIGPSPRGIMERRSPEWIMNMILDPKLMTEQDRCAKDLLIEFNGAAMANQNLTVEETRSILEYFRTL